MFRRKHHVHIATVLQALDADLLADHGCYFGGGTAITLSRQEYRESIDIDFLISNPSGYQILRHLLTENGNINVLTRKGIALDSVKDVRVDQYGIRTMLKVAEAEIKFEIVFEGRLKFETPQPEDLVCGIATLTAVDMGASKLLANSDRWHDDGVFSRDVIDLAMLDLSKPILEKALEKAQGAYGKAVTRDLVKAVDALAERKGRLEECMTALKIDETPKALLWKRIRDLKKAVS